MYSLWLQMFRVASYLWNINNTAITLVLRWLHSKLGSKQLARYWLSLEVGLEGKSGGGCRTFNPFHYLIVAYGIVETTVTGNTLRYFFGGKKVQFQEISSYQFPNTLYFPLVTFKL